MEESPMSTFSQAKDIFDNTLGRERLLQTSLVPVNGTYKKNIALRNPKGEVLEEYYKWQFIYALIYSGLYSKDYIGVEVSFPKGNKTSAPLRIDAAIFDDSDWLKHYD